MKEKRNLHHERLLDIVRENPLSTAADVQAYVDASDSDQGIKGRSIKCDSMLHKMWGLGLVTREGRPYKYRVSNGKTKPVQTTRVKAKPSPPALIEVKMTLLIGDQKVVWTQEQAHAVYELLKHMFERRPT